MQSEHVREEEPSPHKYKYNVIHKYKKHTHHKYKYKGIHKYKKNNRHLDYKIIHKYKTNELTAMHVLKM